MSLSFWCWCHIRFICLFEPISQSILQVTVASPCTNFLGGILGPPRDPIRFTLGPCLPLNHPGHRGIIGASSGPLRAVSGHPRATLWPYRGILGVGFQGSGSADCPSISDLPHKQAGDVSRRPTATLLHSTCCCTTFHCDAAAVDVHMHVVSVGTRETNDWDSGSTGPGFARSERCPNTGREPCGARSASTSPIAADSEDLWGREPPPRRN